MQNLMYAQSYRDLGPQAEVSFLILMAYELTAWTRQMSPAQTARRWPAVNELNNRLMDRALAVMRAEQIGQSEESFIALILRRAEDAGCTRLVEGLFKALVARNARTAPHRG